jgi:hypothetical protein
MPEPLDWSILGTDPSVKTVIPDDRIHAYDLYNLTDSETLVYGSRFGDNINLVWGDPGKSDNIRFVRQSGSKEPIKYDEPIAINVRGGSFLVYEGGRWGINLGWSGTPKYEWRIRGGQAGATVETARPVRLHSTVENDDLIYESRDSGINLKWLRDSGRYDELSDLMRAKETLEKIFGVIFG